MDVQHANHERYASQEAPASLNAQAPVRDDARSGPDPSDNGAAPVLRIVRRYKPLDQAKPSQLRFYSGPWVDTLTEAKNLYRYTMHTDPDNPFPERNATNLGVAHDCLFEALSLLSDDERKERDNGAWLFLSCSVSHDKAKETYQTHKLGMSTLVSNRIVVVNSTNVVGIRSSRMPLLIVGA